MAKIHGKAGENALSKALKKQQNTFVVVILCSIVLLEAVGFLWGLSFAKDLHLKWISALVTILLGGVLFAMNHKFDAIMEKRAREAQNWRRGFEGERVVSDILANELPNTYHVFNDVRFPGRSANIDHLVVGPSGVFVLNTKNWRGTVDWAQDGKSLLLNGEPEKRNSAKAALADALDVHDKLKALLGRDVFVKSVLVFPMAKVVPRLNMPVDLQQDNYLVEKRLKYIDKRTSLSAKEIEEIAVALQALFRKSV